VLIDGTARCWGYNDDGRLGTGVAQPKFTTPQIVAGLSNVQVITAGHNSTCAVLGNRTVTCWGSNEKGKLGHGPGPSGNVPVPVSGLTDMTTVSVGYTHACAAGLGGRVKCWGGNATGALTDGTTTDSSTPVP